MRHLHNSELIAKMYFLRFYLWGILFYPLLPSAGTVSHLAHRWEVVMIKIIRASTFLSISDADTEAKTFSAFTYLILTAAPGAETVRVFILQMRKLGVRAPQWPSWDLKPGVCLVSQAVLPPLWVVLPSPAVGPGLPSNCVFLRGINN